MSRASTPCCASVASSTRPPSSTSRAVGELAAPPLQQRERRQLPVADARAGVVAEVDHHLAAGLGGGARCRRSPRARPPGSARARLRLGRRLGTTSGSGSGRSSSSGSNAGSASASASAVVAPMVSTPSPARASFTAWRVPLPAARGHRRGSRGRARAAHRAARARRRSRRRRPRPWRRSTGTATAPPSTPPASRRASSEPSSAGWPYARCRMRDVGDEEEQPRRSRSAPWAVRRASSDSGAVVDVVDGRRTPAAATAARTAKAMQATGIATRARPSEGAGAVGERRHRPARRGRSRGRGRRARRRPPEPDGGGVGAVAGELAGGRGAALGERARLLRGRARPRRGPARGALPRRLLGFGARATPTPRLGGRHPRTLTPSTPATRASARPYAEHVSLRCRWTPPSTHAPRSAVVRPR